MNWPYDDFPLSPISSHPSQPISTTTTNDPAFTQIYDYLRDFSNTKFDPTPLFNPTNTFDPPTNLPVDHYQQSRTVNPVYTIPTSDQSQTSNQEQQSTVQFVSSKLGKIQIKFHPRSKFRPRTEKESIDSSHYLRCEVYIDSEYPAILIPRSWKDQNNIIEVTLVGNDQQPHPYTIENKERKTSSLIFKQTEPNSLYFHVTDEDYQKGEKTFLIEYIKPRQDGNITKDLIKKRQLDQSMLRFTRYYQIADGSYQEDASSTEYSCLMTEDYGDFTVEDAFPLYGPMSGDQKVCVELKGHLPKDLKTDLIIHITQDRLNWSHQIDNIKKNQNNFTFSMPPFPNPHLNRAKVNILMKYKQDIIHQCSYIYTRKLDEELADDDLNELLGPSSTWSSTGTGGENRSAKRPRQ